MASTYELEVTVSSAKDLKNVSWRYGPLKPYAILYVSPDRKISTRPCEDGDSSPEWNEKLTVPLADDSIDDATLHIEVVHYAAEDDDTKPHIGMAKIALSDVISEEGFGTRAPRSLKVKRPSGRPQGKLKIEIMLRDKQSSYDSNPKGDSEYGQAPSYGYGQPAGQDYPAYGGQPSGYGEPVSGYGQPAAQEEEEKKKSKFGGMGTGLAVGAAAGVVGGLAVAYGIHKIRGDDDDDDDEEADKDEEEDEDDDDDDDEEADKDEEEDEDDD